MVSNHILLLVGAGWVIGCIGYVWGYTNGHRDGKMSEWNRWRR